MENQILRTPIKVMKLIRNLKLIVDIINTDGMLQDLQVNSKKTYRDATGEGKQLIKICLR